MAYRRGMLRMFEVAIEKASAMPRLRTILLIAVAKPTTWPPVMAGGSERAFGSVMTSTRAGPGAAKASRYAPSRRDASSTRSAWKPIARAISA